MEGKYYSPSRFLLIICAAIFFSEGLIMLFLSYLPQLPIAWEILLDASLVTLFALPVLYLFFFRPLAMNAVKREKREDEILGQNEFLNNVLESIPYPFYVTDAKDYTIVKSNSKASREGVAVGAHCYKATHHRDTPCDGEKDICPMEMVKKTKKPVVVEHIHYDKDGKPGFFEVHGYPILDRENNVVQMIEYSVNITKRKKGERDLLKAKNELEEKVGERTNELEESRDAILNVMDDLNMEKEKLEKAYHELKTVDTLKNSILSNVSHEIRTPITIIKGLLEMSRDEEDPKERDEFIKRSLEALDRQNNVVEDLLAVSRIYNRNSELNFHQGNLISVIIDAIDSIKTKAEKRSIEIETQFEENLPLVNLDGKEMFHALHNILDNGVKFNNDEGKIIISAKSLEDEILVKIKDDGIGIRAEEIEKIFDPLTQLDPYAGRKFEGTGNGLAVAKQIIDLHKGTIRAESEGENKGTTIFLKIPIVKQRAGEIESE